MAEGSLPGAPPSTPGLPTNPLPLVFDGFASLNTHETRPAIADQEMFICDGWMPLGKSNLRTLPGIGPVLYSAPTGLTIAYYAFGNFKATPICVVFLSDGSVIQINTNTGSQSPIAPTGTILNPSPTNTDVSQWGSKYLIIVSTQTNGYFLWDGTSLYEAGTLGPDISFDSGGLDYTSVPTIAAVGGSGSGATFTATLQNGSLENISVTNPGSGYAYTDSVYLSFTGGGGAGVTAYAIAAVSGGSVTSIDVISGGAGYSTTASATVSGGGGSGCTATVGVSGGAVVGVTVTVGGDGYTSPPTVYITDGSNPVAQATVSTMPFGLSGSAIETFQSRVWVADVAKISFTSPDSATNVDPGLGAGVFTSNDSFLRIGFQELKQSNGFLYLIADSSLNYISGVQTSGSPPETTFTNQNVDPQIGTPWPNSVQVFSRNIVFGNSFGVHVSYGGAVTKVSEPLDGIWPTQDMLAGFNPSSAVAVIYGVHVYMLLLPIIDQYTGQPVNKLVMWDGKRWWTAQQEVVLQQVATQEINSIMTAWGSDGTNIYPLFQNPSALLTKTVQSKLWDAPGYQFAKVARRMLGIINYNVPSAEALTISVDSENASTVSASNASAQQMTWTNASGQPITWTNATGATIEWVIPGLSTFVFAVGQPGVLVGMTAQTNAPDMTLISLMIIEQNFSPRL